MKKFTKKMALISFLVVITASLAVLPVSAYNWGNCPRRNPTMTYTLDLMDVDQVFDQYSWIRGRNVYIAVLDTGLTSDWAKFIPRDTIKWSWGRRFHDRGLDVEVEEGYYPGPDIVESYDFIASNDQWPDEGHHGTKLISYITGWFYKDEMYGNLPPTFFEGIAPRAKIIPVKVRTAYYNAMGDNLWGEAWSDASLTAGIEYIIDLASRNPRNRFIIEISTGTDDPNEIPETLAAIDRAIEANIPVVASAGNLGFNFGYRGMIYPAAYSPVISVAAAEWGYGNPFTGEYQGSFWPFDIMHLPEERDPEFFNPLSFLDDVPEGDNGQMVGVALGGSRGYPGQDLDVLGVGLMNNPGPGRMYEGQDPGAARLYYYDDIIEYAGGTSGNAAQVAGIVALMLQANPYLTPSEIEEILEETADKINPFGFIWSFVPPMSFFPAGSVLPGPWGDGPGPLNVSYWYPWLDDTGLSVTGAGLVQADAAVERAYEKRWEYWLNWWLNQ